MGAEALADLNAAAVHIKQGLALAFNFDKINDLMLTIVDPDVRHVTPVQVSAWGAAAGRIFHGYRWRGLSGSGR
jgi:hypothetical protein